MTWHFLRLSPTAAALALATMATAPAATAREVCVSNADELRQALAEVSDGGLYVDEATTIRMTAGTYLTEGEAFRSEALSTGARLNLYGGYATGCVQRTPSPTSTVLDAQGRSGVLQITRPSALVDLQRMRVQNGNAEVGAGIRVNYGVTAAASVGFNWIAVVNNHASGDGGGLYVAGAAPAGYGPIQINSALIAGNSAGGEGGGAYLHTSGDGSQSRLGFVTVAANSAGSGSTGGIYASGDQGEYFYRGIVAWGNAPASLYFGRPATIDWSDVESFAVSSLTPASDHLISLDPHFTDAAGGDYRLGSGTPLIRYCPVTAFIPTDLENRYYPAFGSTVRFGNEIGAYLDTVFFDDNDP